MGLASAGVSAAGETARARALVFFPHAPWPPRSGAHARALAQLELLRALGYAPVLCSSRGTSERPWTEEATRWLAARGVEVLLHAPDAEDRAWAAGAGGGFRGLLRRWCGPGLARFFRAAFDRVRPELVLVNYAYWAGLLDALPPGHGAVTAVENHDLVAVNVRLRAVLAEALGPAPYALETCDPRALRLGFPDVAAEGGAELDEEVAAYDAADLCICISRGEGEVIARRARRTEVVHVPVSPSAPGALLAREHGAPVFVASANPFNVQGYLHLAAEVLPRALAREPRLEVRAAGTLSSVVRAHRGVAFLGEVPDLSPLYASASLAVCPLLTATGQQVKIAEAMAHGVPVVAYAATARNSPLVHGESGLVAEGPEEFAEHLVSLWRDPARCRRLGERARQAVADGPDAGGAALQRAIARHRARRAVARAPAAAPPSEAAPRRTAGPRPVLALLAGDPAASAAVEDVPEVGDVVRFAVSGERLSALELPDCCFASAGRYFAEMAARLGELAPSPSGHVVLNPRFDARREQLVRLSAAVGDVATSADATVWADEQGLAAAVHLRRRATRDDVVPLAAVSLLGAAFDADYLAAAFGWKVRVEKVPGLSLQGCGDNGFAAALFDARAAAMPAAVGYGLASRGDRQALRRQVPVLGFHAGDVLFACEGLQAARAKLEIEAFVTVRRYADVPQDVAPWLDVVGVEAKVPGRDGAAVSGTEQAFAFDLAQRAYAAREAEGRPLRALPALLRMHRAPRGRHHFRDLTRFALGDPLARWEESWPPERHQIARGGEASRSVVLHFDGGWPLKSYPVAWRQPLLTLVRDLGLEPVVLGAPDDGLRPSRFEAFKSTRALRELFAGAAAVVGVDSFPAHYAMHVGVPTVHLFASTAQAQYGYPDGPYARTLQHPMACAPCASTVRCAIDGAASCRATATPAEVRDALREVLAARGRRSTPASVGEHRVDAARSGGEDAGSASIDAGAVAYASDYDAAMECAEALARHLAPPARVLELRCGLGALVRRLQERGYAATGAEEPRWAAAARRFSGVRVVAGPAGERFDAVVARVRATARREVTALAREALELAGEGLVVLEVAPPRSGDALGAEELARLVEQAGAASVAVERGAAGTLRAMARGRRS